MIYGNIVLTVNDEKDILEIRELLAEQGRLSRMEPGCERFEVYHSKSDPKTFLLVERWTTQADLDEHRKAKAYTTIYQPQVLPRVSRTPHMSELVE